MNTRLAKWRLIIGSLPPSFSFGYKRLSLKPSSSLCKRYFIFVVVAADNCVCLFLFLIRVKKGLKYSRSSSCLLSLLLLLSWESNDKSSWICRLFYQLMCILVTKLMMKREDDDSGKDCVGVWFVCRLIWREEKKIPKLITLMILLTAMNFLSICSLFALDVFLVGETSFTHWLFLKNHQRMVIMTKFLVFILWKRIRKETWLNQDKFSLDQLSLSGPQT